EVKLSSADDSWGLSPCESRTLLDTEGRWAARKGGAAVFFCITKRRSALLCLALFKLVVVI
ncbi:hypothetical protein, partial [Alkalicoccus chagannorensis]|uniref:hypothetical protein n=1 Tax=Alkalicoccus chagannorensis TaxID=427072 RepID=UPI0039EEA452